MGDSIQDCETPPDGLDRTNAQATEFVNLEAKKQKLLKIAGNNEPDQKNNNNELGEELKDMSREHIVKLCKSKDEWENTLSVSTMLQKQAILTSARYSSQAVQI